MKNEEVLDQYWYALDESCPLALVNEQGRITYVNQKFNGLTGYTLAGVQGPLSDLLHPESHHDDFKKELSEQIRSGKTWQRKICLKHRNGQALCFQAKFYPGPGHDLSRQHLVIFLPESGSRNENKTFSELPLKKFSVMAHDLRNPLNNLSALCGLLLDTSLDERQQEYVSKLKDSVLQLSDMIDAMLRSCMEREPMELLGPKTFNLKRTIENFPLLISEKTASTEIKTRLETDDNLPEEVFGNEHQLSQIVQEMINYLFSREGMQSLRISVLGEDGNGEKHEISFFFLAQYAGPKAEIIPESVVITKDDKGELEKIKSGIAEMDGKTLLEEATPKAIYFHFLIPFGISAPSEPGGVTEPVPELPLQFPPGARILVAEDVELNQLVMKHQLQKIGIEADFVRTGFNVLERLRVNTYDLILMDVQMPGMNGLQTIEAIRADKTKPWHQIPVIGITASIGDHAREQCLRAGADDFVPKPYDLEDLRIKLMKLITAYRQKATPNLEKPPKETDMTEQTKYFDLSYLEEISEGDREFSATMISYFIENTPLEVEKLAKKVQEQDWNEVRQIAHKLKPQVVYMGIHQIEDVVEKVEQLAQHRQALEEVPALVDKIAQVVSLAVGQLKEELKNFS